MSFTIDRREQLAVDRDIMGFAKPLPTLNAEELLLQKKRRATRKLKLCIVELPQSYRAMLRRINTEEFEKLAIFCSRFRLGLAKQALAIVIGRIALQEGHYLPLGGILDELGLGIKGISKLQHRMNKKIPEIFVFEGSIKEIVEDAIIARLGYLRNLGIVEEGDLDDALELVPEYMGSTPGLKHLGRDADIIAALQILLRDDPYRCPDQILRGMLDGKDEKVMTKSAIRTIKRIKRGGYKRFRWMR